MYVVVRKDLQPIVQSIQAGHAAIQFQHDEPQIAKEWHDKSKHLVYLSAKNENHLMDLIFKSQIKNIKYSVFKEPDINNEITAVAFEPKAYRMLANLPLAN